MVFEIREFPTRSTFNCRLYARNELSPYRRRNVVEARLAVLGSPAG